MPNWLKSVKYIVDAEGNPTAAVIDIADWKHLLEWLEAEEKSSDARKALEDALQPIDVERTGWWQWADLQDDLHRKHPPDEG